MTQFLNNRPVEGNTHRGIKPKSGIRGVVFEERTGRWGARAQVDGKLKWLGTFNTAEEAKAAAEEARARNEALNPKAKKTTQPTEPTSVKYLARRKMSVEDVSALVRYNPETGEFFWGPRPREMMGTDKRFAFWNAEMVGRKIAGKTKGKRRKLHINAKAFFDYDVAWAITHGRWPTRPIIHINGNTLDNRACNLIEAAQ